MGLQKLVTEAGEELIVLSKRDYDALLARAGDEEAEDRMTLILAAEARAEEPLPEAVSTAVLNGENLLKAIRIWRGVTQADLASRVGITQGYLSELEKRSKTGTPETLIKLAEGLGIPKGWLI